MRRHDNELDRAIDAVFGDDAPKQDTPPGVTSDRLLAELEALDRLLVEHRRDPDELQRQHLWTRLEARLDAEVTSSPSPHRRTLAISLAAATAIVLVALAIGHSPNRSSAPEETRGPSRGTATGATLTAEARMDRLVARSEPLLMAVSNRPGHGVIALERELATTLADEGRRLLADTDRDLGRRDRRLAAEISAVMLQLSNSEHSGDVDLVRTTLQDRRILIALALRDQRRNGRDPHSEDGRTPRDV